MSETIDHPDHYNQGNVECIDIIDMLNLNFCVGNALKYIWRYQFKGKPIEDLKKAIWYLEHEVEILKQKETAKDTFSITVNSGDTYMKF